MNNDLKEFYGTLSETMNALNVLGYTSDFNIRGECLVCHKTNISLSPDDFKIDKVYRFEGMTNPEDQSILYAISSSSFNMKGLLVNGYGINTDEYSAILVSKLKVHQRDGLKLMPQENTRGHRVLFAPLVEINLTREKNQLIEEMKRTGNDKKSATLFKSEGMQIVLMGLKKNAELKPHHAKGIISVQVLDGLIEFSTKDKTVRLQKEQMITLDKNLEHSVVAIEDTFFLLTLSGN